MTRMRKKAIVETLAALLGGAAGALVAYWLERLGVKPQMAAAGVAIAGAVGAAATTGVVRHAAAGAAAAGAGQLAVSWFRALDRRIEQASQQPVGAVRCAA